VVGRSSGGDSRPWTVGIMVARRATTLAAARRHGDSASPRPLPPILLATVARRAEVPEFPSRSVDRGGPHHPVAAGRLATTSC
jgi:hypothetical protein